MYKLPKNETNAFIDTVTGLTSVTRFHGHSVIRDQSVADHSGRVGMMTFCLALEFYKNEVDAYRAASFGLFHDFTEGILKNDANSTIKQKYGIRDILKQIETEVVSDLFSSDTSATNILKSLLLEHCSSTDYQLLKMADTLDFGLYVWHEINLGNKHMLPLLESFKLEFERYSDEIKSLSFAQLTKSKILGG